MDPLAKLKQDIENQTWFTIRSYRSEQKQVVNDYWRILSMILLSSHLRAGSNKRYTAEQFQPILINSFNHIFLQISKTKQNLLNIGRGFQRGFWEKESLLISDYMQQAFSELKDTAHHIHQSILASSANDVLIWRDSPEIYDLTTYNHWHKRLNQPFSGAISPHYPPELFIAEDADSVKVVLDIHVSPNLIESWQKVTQKGVRASYILFLLERIETFFTAHPDQPTFAEDRVI